MGWEAPIKTDISVAVMEATHLLLAVMIGCQRALFTLVACSDGRVLSNTVYTCCLQ